MSALELPCERRFCGGLCRALNIVDLAIRAYGAFRCRSRMRISLEAVDKAVDNGPVRLRVVVLITRNLRVGRGIVAIHLLVGIRHLGLLRCPIAGAAVEVVQSDSFRAYLLRSEE